MSNLLPTKAEEKLHNLMDVVRKEAKKSNCVVVVCVAGKEEVSKASSAIFGTSGILNQKILADMSTLDAKMVLAALIESLNNQLEHFDDIKDIVKDEMIERKKDSEEHLEKLSNTLGKSVDDLTLDDIKKYGNSDDKSLHSLDELEELEDLLADVLSTIKEGKKEFKKSGEELKSVSPLKSVIKKIKDTLK